MLCGTKFHYRIFRWGDSWNAGTKSTRQTRATHRDSGFACDDLGGRRPHRGDADKRTGVNSLVDTAVAVDRAFPPTIARSIPNMGPTLKASSLAGIMGSHNLCLDLFGGPSEAEAAAGPTVHGEGSVATYEITAGPARL
jgi:hypothetical protein